MAKEITPDVAPEPDPLLSDLEIANLREAMLRGDRAWQYAIGCVIGARLAGRSLEREAR